MKKNEKLPSWIVSNFPENQKELTYVEPYCSDTDIFFEKEKSEIEVINVRNSSDMYIYHALRDESKELLKRLNLFKICEETFEKLQQKNEEEDYLDASIREIILRKFSKNGLKKVFNPKIEKETWKEYLKELSDVSKRLQGVFIFNKDALQVINSFNTKGILLYCKPPYLHEAKLSKTVYSSELSTEEHMQLSHALNNFNGNVIISGYSSPLYNRLYKDWNTVKSKMSSEKQKKENKTEVIWKNY